MAKTVIKQVKLQIPAGKANPAPPVGPALGQAGNEHINGRPGADAYNGALGDELHGSLGHHLLLAVLVHANWLPKKNARKCGHIITVLGLVQALKVS